jgi:hypothetical protein
MTRRAAALAIALGACTGDGPAPRDRMADDAGDARGFVLDVTPGAPLQSDDPVAALAREEEALLLQRCGEWVIRTVSPARRVDSPALREVFPGHAFLYLSWQDRAADPERPIHIAHLLYAITAIAPDGSRSRHFGYGEHESFGGLLARAGVRIRTEEEARRVYRAYCDLFRKSWTLPCVRESATVWRLGVVLVGGRRYSYEVVVGAGGEVVSGKCVGTDSTRSSPGAGPGGAGARAPPQGPSR